MIFDIFYYSFSGFVLASGLMVIGSLNPMHSVLFLVLVFFNIASLFILLGAEFLAMLFLVVYVGAIAVLFLFVVMMLPTYGVRFKNESFGKYLPLGGLIGFIFGLELFFVLFDGSLLFDDFYFEQTKWSFLINSFTNTQVLGFLLYDAFLFYFIISGMILLVAMLGAIILTMHRRGDVRRQEVYSQVIRDFNKAISLEKLKV